MKKRMIASVILMTVLLCGSSFSVFAETQTKLPLVEEAVPEDKEGETGTDNGEAEEAVLRNTTFTTSAQMQQLLGTDDPSDWSVLYLPVVEQYYWNFSATGCQDNREMSMNLVSNAYQNLEMFLDNGYLLDYNELAEYAADYLVRKGEPDAYYTILTDCLKNPYLLNKPEAEVTDYTYNGRDYSAVFDPDYYYDTNPDLQLSIGFNPPELLRHFVEKGIIEGRRGNAELDMDTYIAYTDGQIALGMAGLQAPGTMPVVAKYSYSRANYYGKLLGHYEYSAVYGLPLEDETAGTGEENAADW